MKRGVKVTPRTQKYRDNFDSNFRKKRKKAETNIGWVPRREKWQK